MPQAASDAEEDTMDEELGALSTVADVDAVDAEDAADAEAVGLSVYKDPNVQSSVNRRNKLNDEYKKYYDDLTAKIMAQRTGPTFSERMFQLSAALAQPTTRRGFGGVLENITPVLAAQQKAQREGITKRQDALSALQAAQLAQRVALANQDVSTATAMAKINAAANKPVDPFRGAVYDPNTMRWVPRPGTAGAPPVLTPEQAAEYARDPKNRGMKFYTTDGRSMEIK